MIIQIFGQNYIVNQDNLIIYFNETIFNIIKSYDDELAVKLNYIKINIYNKKINKIYNNLRFLCKSRENKLQFIRNICPHNKLYQECNDEFHRIYYDYYCDLCHKCINKTKETYDSKVIRNKSNYVETIFIKKRKLI